MMQILKSGMRRIMKKKKMNKDGIKMVIWGLIGVSIPFIVLEILKAIVIRFYM